MGLLVIVDVRSDAEWAQVRVPGATHIPLGQVARRLHEVRSDRPVAFVCRSGHRSAMAVRRAARQRVDVASVAGGMTPGSRPASPRPAACLREHRG